MKEYLEKLGKELDSIIETIEKTEKEGKPVKRFEFLVQALGKLGFRFLDSGTSREVFVNEEKGLVVKIELGLATSNRTEISIALLSDYLPESLRDFFLKPLAYDKKKFNWIIYPFVKTGRELYRIFYFEIIRVKTEASKYGISFCDLAEFNMGLYNDKVVFLDYGYERELSLYLKAKFIRDHGKEALKSLFDKTFFDLIW